MLRCPTSPPCWPGRSIARTRKSVRLLLKAGAKPRAVDIDGASPLTLACELGGAAIVEDLLTAGADAAATRPDGISALSLCAGTSNPEALAALLAKGADVNGADPTGQTPLMWAAAKGRTDNIAFLLKHGANVNASTKKGFTALIFALKSKVAAAPDMLADAGADTGAALPDGTSVLQAAIAEHDMPFAERLVAADPDVNRWNARGLQLIHVAASSGDAGLIKLVLSRGGDPNALSNPPPPPKPPPPPPPKDGKPLQGFAAYLALMAKAYDVPSPLSPTPPLQLAARAGSVDAMKVLVQAGADPKLTAQDGSTLAMAAASGGNLEALKYAVELDPDINVLTHDGRSILHMVVKNPHGADNPAMLQFLVDKGAKLEVADHAGVTPGIIVNRSGPQSVGSPTSKSSPIAASSRLSIENAVAAWPWSAPALKNRNVEGCASKRCRAS